MISKGKRFTYQSIGMMDFANKMNQNLESNNRGSAMAAENRSRESKLGWCFTSKMVPKFRRNNTQELGTMSAKIRE